MVCLDAETEFELTWNIVIQTFVALCSHAYAGGSMKLDELLPATSALIVLHQIHPAADLVTPHQCRGERLQ